MFNVKVGDTEYHVSFNYNENLTMCFVCLKENVDSDLIAPVVATGFSVCKYPDMFVKNKGRKHSLKSALKSLGFDRETRTLFWNKYWEKRGKID